MTFIRTWLGLAGLLSVAGLPLAGQAKSLAPLSELEARSRSDSLDAAAWYELSIGYYRAKRADDEERALRRAIAIDPRYAPAFLSLAYLPFQRRPKLQQELRKGKVPPEWRAAGDESERLVNRAFLIDPLVDLRVLGVEPPREEDMVVIRDYGPATTDYLLRLGIGAFSVTRYELAHSALQEWAGRAYAGKPPDSLPDFLFWYRGLAAAHLRSWRRAIADFATLLTRSQQRELVDTLIQVQLHTNDYRYVLAVLHDAAGKPADAINLYKETLASDLGHYMAHVRLAQVYRRVKMWEPAVTEAQRAVETNPDDASAMVELGVILLEAGRAAEAVAALGEARIANPRDVRVLYHLGIAQGLTADSGSARATLQEFVALAPKRYETLVDDARQRLARVP